VETGAIIPTENTHVVDFRFTRKIFSLNSLFCTSLSILLKLVLHKNDVRDKKKVKVISSKF